MQARIHYFFRTPFTRFDWPTIMLVIILAGLVVFPHKALAQNYCSSITESIDRTCKQTPVDLCEVNDDLMFRKLSRLAERAGTVSQAQFEKYKSLLKAEASEKTIKGLRQLQEEVTPCLTATHALWSLLLKQGAVKNNRKTAVQNLVRKKLLSADLYSFTLDSLRERIFLIQEAAAYDLISLNTDQAKQWKDLVEGFKQEKDLNPDRSNKIPYSQKSAKSAAKLTPPTESSANAEAELKSLNELFVKVRSGHQQINSFF